MPTSTKSSPAQSALLTLFTNELRDILWAETQLFKTLPKLAAKAKSPALKTAFTSHCKETEGQIERLEQIFEQLGLKPKAEKCEAMAGLLEEGASLMKEFAKSPALDAALISAGQKVEHYEIATYGTLCAFAKRLGLHEALPLLTQTLKEEGAADKKLTAIAEGEANAEAEDEE